MFSLKKMLFSAKCIFDRIGAMKFFWEKKLDAGFKKITFFKLKNDLFGQFLVPPNFRAEGPKQFFDLFFTYPPFPTPPQILVSFSLLEVRFCPGGGVNLKDHSLALYLGLALTPNPPWK